MKTEQRCLIQLVIFFALLICIKIFYLSITQEHAAVPNFSTSSSAILDHKNYSKLGTLAPPKSTNFKNEDIFRRGFPLLKTFYNTTLSPPGIILQIKGGIGNRLFEYACSYALAKRKNWPLYIDYPAQSLSDRQFKPYQREFSLDTFNIPLDNIIHLGLTRLPPTQPLLLTTDEDWLNGRFNNSYQFIQLAGGSYCRSELYWMEYEQDIQNMFQVRPASLNWTRIQKYVDEITTTESVALHVRRGDFQRADKFAFPTQFQMKAVPLMGEMLRKQRKVEDPIFFVFSDDPAYASRKFQKFSKKFRFVYVSGGNNTSVEDFYLMQLCKHIIFPNSTFSWWAATLNRNKNKIVITSAFNSQFWKLWIADKKTKESYKTQFGTMYHRKEWIVIDRFSGGLLVR